MSSAVYIESATSEGKIENPDTVAGYERSGYYQEQVKRFERHWWLHLKKIAVKFVTSNMLSQGY